ncbi:DNA-directed RNA polymerases i and iii subunit, partial [Globisporangium splendens]
MATVKKLDVHTASSDYSKTYVFHEEDHTLGNALRHVLMRNCRCVAVSFANFAFATVLCATGVPSDEALRSGLTDLRKVSSTISDAYRKELKAFNRKRKN